jgi:VanZ family protein
MFLKYARWSFVIVWMVIIWILSSIPDLRSGFEQDFLLRKIAHGLVFAVLTFLIFRALPARLEKGNLRLAYAGAAALLYALIDEVHQTFVPGRSGALTDVAIDAIGIVAMLLLLSVLVNSRRYRLAAKLTR